MRLFRLFCSAALLSLAPLMPTMARADTSAEERVSYEIVLAGIEVGDMEVSVRRDRDRYRARLEGSYRVLVWSGSLTSEVQGRIARRGPVPYRFLARSQSDEPSTTIIDFNATEGPINWRRTPEAPREWTEGRLPLQRHHLRTALDPVTAIAASALGPIGGKAPDVCGRAVRVFTGTVVFELSFDGSRAERDDHVICFLRYRALSGHRAKSTNVERLSRPGSIQIAFDRLPSGLWLPARVSLPTRIGTLVVERI